MTKLAKSHTQGQLVERLSLIQEMRIKVDQVNQVIRMNFSSKILRVYYPRNLMFRQIIIWMKIFRKMRALKALFPKSLKRHYRQNVQVQAMKTSLIFF